MPALVPNSPIGRLRHVIRQYNGSKVQRILPDVIVIALYAFGRDYAARGLVDAMGTMSPTADAATSWKHNVGRPADPADVKRLEEWLVYHLPEDHQWDFIVPWVAKELGRLRKAIDRQATRRVRGLPPEAPDWEMEGVIPGRGLDEYDYNNVVSILTSKTPAIAMWAKQTRANLNQTTLADALEAIKDFEFEEPTREVPQGDVVMEFEDGYTIQRLGPEALRDEGEIMQHCVGSYCEQVENDETVIFSLRDPKGMPHVTIEWEYQWNAPIAATRRDIDAVQQDVGLDDTLQTGPFNSYPMQFFGRFVQIMGKQNEPPAHKYRPYVQRFIQERFNSDPVGLLMVYTEGLPISFAGKRIVNVDFGDLINLLLSEGEEEWNVNDLDFSGGYFGNCRMQLALTGARFAGAEFVLCFLGGPSYSFNGCDFSGARFHRGRLVEGGEFVNCDFSNTIWEEFDIKAQRLEVCNFRRSVVRDTTLQGAALGCWFEQSRWRRVDLVYIYLAQCLFTGAEWDSTKIVGGGSRDGSVAMEGLDLRQVTMDDYTQDQIIEAAELGLIRRSVRLPSEVEDRIEWP